MHAFFFNDKETELLAVTSQSWKYFHLVRENFGKRNENNGYVFEYKIQRVKKHLVLILRL